LDYDDLFSEKPYEAGRTGKKADAGELFGIRIYNDYQAVLDDLNRRLIFSIEDDLDYAIAKDDFLYRQYLINLQKVLTGLTPGYIDSTFSNIRTTLLPFYQVPEVIEMSQYDVDPTNLEAFDSNLTAKKDLLLKRVEWINTELQQQDGFDPESE
jgi:hypothetical protein